MTQWKAGECITVLSISGITVFNGTYSGTDSVLDTLWYLNLYCPAFHWVAGLGIGQTCAGPEEQREMLADFDSRVALLKRTYRILEESETGPA